ncbi:hypothetical protein OH76DRAFT_427008 [Lentinus brumalis]|uniref:Uncharacterized protein n=1 Tax=Lentinus brumalis TaxID=2498619 RepID=A0A371DWL7_9APHY|nr:hypothetical protein OH76DRAFT_427008 [Polyporus brumalis]
MRDVTSRGGADVSTLVVTSSESAVRPTLCTEDHHACCTLRASGWAPGGCWSLGEQGRWRFCVVVCPHTRLRRHAGNSRVGTGTDANANAQVALGEPGQASRRQRGETGEDADTGQASRWRSLALAYCHGTLLRCRRPRPRSCALVNLAARETVTRRRLRNICVRGGAAQRQNAGQLPASPRSIILKNGPDDGSSWGAKAGRVE